MQKAYTNAIPWDKHEDSQIVKEAKHQQERDADTDDGSSLFTRCQILDMLCARQVRTAEETRAEDRT